MQSARSNTSPQRLQAAQILASTARDFYRNGWMWGTSGNLSVCLSHDPLQFLITASGRDKGQLTVDDVLLMGAAGAVLEAHDGKPSAETPIHDCIYQRFHAGAVFHVHTVMAGVVSDFFYPQRAVVWENLEMLKGLGYSAPNVHVRLPIVDNHAESDVVAHWVEEAARQEVPGILIRNHGLYAWGASAAEARNHVEIFEYLFGYIYHRTLLSR